MPFGSFGLTLASIIASFVAVFSIAFAILGLDVDGNSEADTFKPVENFSDLGKVEQGKIVNFVRLRNTFKTPVRVVEVRTACRCIVAKSPKATVEVGAEYEIPFEWSTLGMRGYSSTALTVHYMVEGQKESRSELVYIGGEVQSRYDVAPTALSFKQSSVDKVVVTLIDKTLGRQPKIEHFACESPAISFYRLSESSVEVAFDGSKWKDSPGFRPKITLKVDVESEPLLEIPVKVNQ